MFARMLIRNLGICAVPLAAMLFVPVVTQAQHPCSDHHCQRFHCPPGLKHRQEGSPRIHFQRGCPRPICNPCTNPNWGYFEPSWSAWPWPSSVSHYPAATVVLNPQGGSTPPVTDLPPPRPAR
jgi:hypothetical protein